MSTFVSVRMAPELKRLLADRADLEGVPLGEIVTRIIAKELCRPELAAVPRKRMGRPRKALQAV